MFKINSWSENKALLYVLLEKLWCCLCCHRLWTPVKQNRKHFGSPSYLLTKLFRNNSRVSQLCYILTCAFWKLHLIFSFWKSCIPPATEKLFRCGEVVPMLPATEVVMAGYWPSWDYSGQSCFTAPFVSSIIQTQPLHKDQEINQSVILTVTTETTYSPLPPSTSFNAETCFCLHCVG